MESFISILKVFCNDFMEYQRRHAIAAEISADALRSIEIAVLRALEQDTGGSKAQ